MTSEYDRTVGYEDAFNLSVALCAEVHVLLCLVAPGAARLGVCAVCGVADVHLCGEFGEIHRSGPSLYLLAGQWPAEQKRPVVFIRKNLKHAFKGMRLGDVLHETVGEKLDLLLAHVRRATPVSPARLVHFVIVAVRNVYHGVDEAQHHTICGPVDDDVYGHIVIV